MRYKVFLAIAALLFFVAPRSMAIADNPEPYELYAILGLTGAGTFVGQGQQVTLNVLENVVNEEGGISARKIHFTILDNKSDPQVTIQLANDILAKKVPVVFVSGLLAACRAIVPLMNAGPVEFCLSPALYPEKNSYVFAAGPSSRDQLTSALRFLAGRHIQRVAVITSLDATGLDADNQIAALFALPEYKALHLVDQEHFADGDIGISAQLAKLKGSDPQAVLVWTSGTPF
jgi:branched-chain amino acid transport system substrate-binding protein